MVYVATLVGYIKYYSKKQKYNIKRVNKNKRKHDLLLTLFDTGSKIYV